MTLAHKEKCRPTDRRPRNKSRQIIAYQDAKNIHQAKEPLKQTLRGGLNIQIQKNEISCIPAQKSAENQKTLI